MVQLAILRLLTVQRWQNRTQVYETSNEMICSYFNGVNVHTCMYNKG